jgi:uncharacterized lipoprotein YddW (UPF0748 family)
MSIRIAGVCLTVALGLLLAGAAPSAIDDCRYPDDAAAQAVWQPMRGSAPARAVRVDGVAALRLTCNFAGTTFERASWDRKGKLDLSSYQGIELKVRVDKPGPVARFNIYFQSGEGWYTASFFPDAAGRWTTVDIDKAAAHVEGRPAGWGSVETIRVSAWRGRDEDTEILLGGIRGYGVLGQDASVAILRADSLAGESRSVAEFSATVASQLGALGVRYATLSDRDVSAAHLRAAKVVILPHNPSLTERATVELVRYVEGGGRLLVFYSLPAQLRRTVGIEGGAHVKAQLSAIRFAPRALPGAPETVGQRSWNLSEAKPVEGRSRVLAEWLDEQGRPTGHAAVVASQSCIVMTHVLLKDDGANKRRMLLAMIGQLAPEVVKPAVATSIERLGRVGPARSFDEAAKQISASAKKDQEVRSRLNSAKRMRNEARKLSDKGKQVDAASRVASAGQLLMEAYVRAQRPEPGEFRAFWCHSAFGVQGLDWEEAIRRLAAGGFNAIVPNMLWGGSAFYPSKVLPVAASVAEKGDQVAQCLTAARKHGVQVHVWKVNWNLGHYVPADFVERMRKESRVQVSSRGKQEPWLCPSHPENRELEIASMVEVAEKYEVDGIHFDYIRYPDGDHCFCDGCRARFSQAAGVTVRDWPREVLADGPYRRQWLDWRRSNINAVVEAVSQQARRVRPQIKISAAVFRNWAVDRDGVGQDWKLWCERGWLDFVCPMDYTDSGSQFDVWVAAQKEWAGKVPVYPGIGASSSSSTLPADAVIGQILTARRHRTGGFVIFNYGVNEANDLLPMLGLGITKALIRRSRN